LDFIERDADGQQADMGNLNLQRIPRSSANALVAKE
jgi:hypothetical protein